MNITKPRSALQMLYMTLYWFESRIKRIILQNFHFIAAKYVNHKGRSRHFTSPEELEEQRKKKLQKYVLRQIVFDAVNLDVTTRLNAIHRCQK